MSITASSQLRMVPSRSGHNPSTEEALDEARTYLSALADRLRTGPVADLKLSILIAVEVGKDVANTLLKVAEHGEDAEGSPGLGRCDLIALATHGRGGLQRLAMGSVTERVLGAAKLPVLVIRPQDVQATTEHTPPSSEKGAITAASQEQAILSPLAHNGEQTER